jgi:hypothetical protein
MGSESVLQCWRSQMESVRSVHRHSLRQLMCIIETIPTVMELPVARRISAEAGGTCREVSIGCLLSRDY